MSTPDELLITGATGRIGRLVAVHLVELGYTPRVLVRDVEKARASLPREVSVIKGDFDDEPSLVRALDGVGAVLLVSPVHPEQRRFQGNVARAAAAAGGGQPLVVKLSGLGTRPDSPVDSGRWHAESEADIQALGLPYVFLRPNFFMQNLAFNVPIARSQGVLRGAVDDARIAMVDVRDIADVAAELLAGRVDCTGEALTLTTSEAHSYEYVAALLSELLGRGVRYERQTLEQTRDALSKAGMPGWHVDIIVQFNREFAAGGASETTDAVERVLGRAPRTLRDYLAEQVASSAPAAGENPLPS